MWPGDLTIEVLRKRLENTGDTQIRLFLEALHPAELDTVLDVVLHPSCTDRMLDNLKGMPFGFEHTQVIVCTHVFIHQTWKKTSKILAGADDFDKEGMLVKAAGALAMKTFKRKQFALIKFIFKAINQKYAQKLIDHVLICLLGLVVTQSYALARHFVMHDTGDYITAEIFRTLSRQGKLTIQDFVRLLEHPKVESEQFAEIINAHLSCEKCPRDVTRDLVRTTGSSDVPALKKHLTSRNLQQRFLQYYFDLEVLTDTNSAWSVIALKEKDRHEGWYRENGVLILAQLLQSMGQSFPLIAYSLIMGYLA